MENAIIELSQEHNAGVLVWFLELLWAQPSVKKNTEDDDATPPPAYFADFPTIPHTVVFNYSHAQGWFFEPSSLKHGTLRRIRRKRRQHLVAKDIFEELSMPFDAAAASKKKRGISSADGEDTDGPLQPNTDATRRRQPSKDHSDAHRLVAQLITKGAVTNVLHPQITYLTQEGLEALLFHGTISEGSLLQAFLMPQGPRTDPNANSNVTLSVVWQPTYCYVERYVNQHALGDGSKLPDERGATHENAKVSLVTALGNNATTLLRCRKACNAIAQHIFCVTGRHIRSMNCVMKIDTQNRLNLLYVQRVTIAETQRSPMDRLRSIRSLVSKHVVDDGSPGGNSDGDDSDSCDDNAVAHNPRARKSSELDAMRNIAQCRERITELSRCKSGAYRAKLQALIPEEVADVAFKSIAPRSWSMEGRQAYRFAAIPSRMTSHRSRPRSGDSYDPPSPGDNPENLSMSSSMHRSSNPSGFNIPSPKIGASFRKPSLAGNSFASAMRQVERDISVKSEATVTISAARWSNSDTPSRVEVALMKDTATDLYPLKRVAHSATALGLREKYLASMKAASAGRRSSSAEVSGW